jgi:hypothetical protein
MPLMVRSSEYTWRRRMAMQVVLCAALGLTVALAWWVSRTRAAALAVKLGPPQLFVNKVMSLNVRLPIGWVIKDFDDQVPPELLASESETSFGAQRMLIIAVQRERAANGHLPTPEEIASSDMDGRTFSPPARQFEFLGNPGVILEYPPKPGEKLRPILRASTVIPGPKPVAVTVTLGLEALRPFIPSDFDLLKSVAQSLRRANLSEHGIPPIQADPDSNEDR